jgi:zinc protease
MHPRHALPERLLPILRRGAALLLAHVTAPHLAIGQSTQQGPGAPPAGLELSAPLPVDTAVHRGRLPNGVRYLIRRNGRPEKRAELRLVVDAGSVQETDAQRGIAHFVEHMAFNGTRRFPKAAIVNFLERAGMAFGADLNASTSFDETIYQLQIPTDSTHLVVTALDILEDWAHGVSFEPAEIAKERGVVIEEWRTGRDASTRVQNKQFPVMLRGSRYAERLPIGTPENLAAFADSLPGAFYRDWYRPDLMTVVAVGDFDIATMEAAIRERFARLTIPARVLPRQSPTVPDHAETLISIETDKEYPSSTISLLWLYPPDSMRTIGDRRRTLITGFFDGMLNARLGEMAQRPDAPFAFASGARGPFVRTRNGFELDATVKENGFERAGLAMLSEVERVARFGFTASEFERRRTNYLRSLEQAYLERDKSHSAGLADSYATAAITGAPIVGIEHDKTLGERLLATITLDEVNAVARRSLGTTNRVLLVAAPERADVPLPDQVTLLTLFERARAATLVAYVDSSSDAALVPRPPAAGRIVAERTLPETGILEWTLSNGARMLLKPTDFKADEVLFAAQSPGGISLLADADVPTAELSDYVLSAGGLGSFNAIALGKKLTGLRAWAEASLGDVEEHLSGTASARDLPTMFQLAWLRFTAPRVDAPAWEAFKNQVRTILDNQKNSPEAVFADTMQLTLAQHHPRVRIVTSAMLDEVQLPRVLEIARERFADASGFTFFLVGSFSPDSVRPLVEQWVASLPATHAAEQARDVGIRPPSGVVEKTVRMGVEPKAQTSFVFTGPCTYSMPARYALSSLRELLEIRLRESLREEKGGTYGVSVAASCTHIPYAHYTLSIGFGSAPERVDELTTAMWQVVEEIQNGVVSDSNLTKIREIQLRGHETGLRQNGSWLSAMMDADEDGRDQRDYLRYPELVKSLSIEQLREAARRYITRGRYAKFRLVPATTGAPPKPDR